MKKDFQFNMSFNSPFSIFTDDQNDTNEYAKATTFSAIESNPYAPISAKTLAEKKAVAFIDKYNPSGTHSRYRHMCAYSCDRQRVSFLTPV